jgi:hypothetical protein
MPLGKGPFLGVHESTVWHWEHGGTRPNEENGARIEEFSGDRDGLLGAL